MRLTDLSIKNLPIPEKGQKTYWDGGFGVRVSQGGSKTFVMMKGKERKLFTIGRYPAMSLKSARQEALRLKVTETPKQALQSLSAAREAYLKECEQKNRPATVHVYRNYLSKLDKKHLTDVTKADVDISSPHAVTTWKVFFNWCIRNELVDRNPFAHQSVSYGQRSRVLTDAEITTIMAYDAPPFSHILKLCLLTGQRKGEVTQFCPEWIDGDTITIPAAVAKNGHEHTIPFNLLTARYLSEYQHQSFNGFGKAKARFDALYPWPHWTIHDLRRTFATIHARIGTPIHVVEAMLNHRSGTVSGVAAIYIRHSFLEEARAAALKYELFIAKLTGA
ncbi:tyrosine-type recombinase/integrase [Palleronia sp. KMU-117]|uniref:tyrosine-type recombinase/integrase n=1 Tax=Palleronia sp. KMU-117 TaxID=3434108 RepID=UPI003D71C0D3